MEVLGALGAIVFAFFVFVTSAFIIDTKELVDEGDLRAGREVLVSNGDKYICRPTELTIKKMELEKALEEYSKVK